MFHLWKKKNLLHLTSFDMNTRNAYLLSNGTGRDKFRIFGINALIKAMNTYFTVKY